MRWSEMVSSGEMRGRWVALDNVRYGASSSHPTEGTLVDSDEDLAVLCTRMRASDRTNCAIVYLDQASPPSTLRPTRATSRLS